MQKAGIQNVAWHTLRHTPASRLVMTGVPLPTVKEILGHWDLQTTLRYVHLSPGHIQTAAEKGSLAHLGMGTGSEGKADERERTQAVDSIGAPDRSRTCNLLIRSQVLYPLSYGRYVWFINDLGESVKIAEWARVK